MAELNLNSVEDLNGLIINVGDRVFELHEICLEENWKPIPDYEGLYEASDLGRIRSLIHSKPRILKQTPTEKGYMKVKLSKDGQVKTCRVARLVLSTFRPLTLWEKEMKPALQVDHINGNRKDDRLANLEWVTPSENISRAYRNGLIVGAHRDPKPVIDLETGILYGSLREAAKKTGVHLATVSGHCRNMCKNKRFAYAEDMINDQ